MARCSAVAGGIPISQEFVRHPIDDPALPELPPGIDLRKGPIKISMRLFIDRGGSVVRVCSVRPEGRVSPEIDRLTEAAANSVRKWKYPENFGLVGELKITHRYVQGMVTFEFTGPAKTTADIESRHADE